MNETVTLVNRTNKTLTGMWDSKVHTFPPGETPNVDVQMAWKFRNQNPVMGTEDPFTGHTLYKLTSESFGDDVSSLDIDDSNQFERINRAMIPGGDNVEYKPLPNYGVAGSANAIGGLPLAIADGDGPQ